MNIFLVNIHIKTTKQSCANATKCFLGFLLQTLAQFEEILSKIATFRHCIHGGCQDKMRFGRKYVFLS